MCLYTLCAYIILNIDRYSAKCSFPCLLCFKMKQYNRKPKVYNIEVEVSYVPFPSEYARKEAYYTHAKLFLRAKERMLKEQYKKPQPENSSNYRNKKGSLETALSSFSPFFLFFSPPMRFRAVFTSNFRI